MNWLDFVLAIIILCSVIAGFRRGLARAVFGLAATILGLFCGLWFYGIPGAYFAGWFSSPELANLIGFLVIFIGIVVVGALLGYLLERLLRLANLSWLNRLLGGAFGVLEGLLVAAIIVMAMLAFSAKLPSRSVANSRVAPYVIESARVLVAAAPREVKDAFRNSYDRVKEIWADTLKHGIRKLPGQTI